MSRTFQGPKDSERDWTSIDGRDPMSLTYADVSLAPNPKSPIESRSEVDTRVNFFGNQIVPIISAPMDSLATFKDFQLIEAMAKAGAIGTFPWAKDIDQACETFRYLSGNGTPYVASFRLNDPLSVPKRFLDSGARILMLDTAHGGQARVEGIVRQLKDSLGKTVPLIVGNIATYNQGLWYRDMGVDMAKVGIGAGSVCTTRIVTGVGVPQFSAICDVMESEIPIIADGGIKEPGDICKAVAAGANMVMIGGMLAGTNEAASGDYRGQASFSYMHDHKLVKAGRAPEGVEVKDVPEKGPLENIITEIDAALRSAMSYVGAKDLQEFFAKARFVLNSPAARAESLPHFAFTHGSNGGNGKNGHQ